MFQSPSNRNGVPMKGPKRRWLRWAAAGALVALAAWAVWSVGRLNVPGAKLAACIRQEQPSGALYVLADDTSGERQVSCNLTPGEQEAFLRLLEAYTFRRAEQRPAPARSEAYHYVGFFREGGSQPCIVRCYPEGLFTFDYSGGGDNRPASYVLEAPPALEEFFASLPAQG